MRVFITVLLIAGTFCRSRAEITSLVALLEQGRIQLSPHGTGGHSGECLKVDVRNLSSSPIRTSIPPGWVFPSEKPEVQDLIVMREEVIVLAPGQRRTVTCRAFCCEASHSGPAENEPFRKGHPASATLIALAQLVDSGAYADHIVQNAVWVLSDGNDINSTGPMDSSADDRLRNRLSALSDQPIPRYTVRYANTEQQACSRRPETISRTIAIDPSTAQHLTVVVKSDNGRVVELIHRDLLVAAGRTALPISLNVLNWPAGRYAFYVYTTESTPVHRLPFTL
ncbi:MAG: hypothetical protein IPO90_03435 [Flavobacteriales bacterium]|nr:hypothetical protein [Flavobacteriales bacterium]